MSRDSSRRICCASLAIGLLNIGHGPLAAQEGERHTGNHKKFFHSVYLA